MHEEYPGASRMENKSITWRRTSMREQTKTVPWFVVLFSLIGSAGTLLGTYWDDAWHTDRGRDSFLTPPHDLLYTGILLIGASAVLWAATVFYRERRWSTIFHSPPLLLALIGDAVTVAAIPIDNAWHLAFGRDAVLWSPPHLLAVVGMFAVGTGLLLGRPRIPGWRGFLLTSTLATLVLGATLIPVMEYEADVPQFAPFWYLPVLTIGLVLALSLLHATDERPWLATTTTLWYILIRLGVVAFLWLAGFSLTLIPPLLLPAFVFDLTVRFRLPHTLRAVFVALTVYLSFVPYLNVFLNGMTLTPFDVLPGLPLAAFGSWLIMALLEAPRLPWRQLKQGILLVLVLLLLWPGQAFAHDPGQGQVIGTVQLQATVYQSRVVLTGTVADEKLCQQLIPRTIEARRAGTIMTSTLSWKSACQFQGTLLISARGRWFVYAELRRFQQPVETWLPVEVQTTTTQFARDAPLYLRETTSGSAVEVLSSVFLYLVMLLLLGTALWTARRLSALRWGESSRAGEGRAGS